MSEVKVVISGDPAGLKKAAYEGAVALEKMQLAGKGLEQQSGKNTAAAERFIESLKKEALQLAHGERAVRFYEASKAGLSGAMLREAEAVIVAMEAHKQYEAQLARQGAAAERFGRTLGSLTNTAILAAAAFAGMVGKESISKASEMEQGMLRLAAVVRATGQSAGFTATELGEMAEKLKAVTLFDDDDIRAAQTALLSFRSVSGEIFEQTLELAANTASVMKRDLPQAATAWGKALEDPIKGLRLLRGENIVFSEAQRDLIKTLQDSGRFQQAQLTMIEAGRKIYGNAARELDTGLKKSTVDAGQAWEDLLKTLGKTELIGGNATKFLGGIAEVLGDIRAQIESGSFERLNGFLLKLAGGALKAALPGVGQVTGMALDKLGDQWGAQSLRPKDAGMLPKLDAAERAIAKINGQMAQLDLATERVMLKQGQLGEAADKAGKKASAAYDRTKASVESFLQALEKEAALMGKSAAEKRTYEAMLVAVTLRTDEERVAFWKRFDAVEANIAANEKRLELDKQLAELAKESARDTERHQKGLEDGTAALERELATLTRKNDEVGKSREAIEQETLAKMESRLASIEYVEGADAETEALRRRIEIQRKIITEGKRSDRLAEEQASKKTWDKATEQIEQSVSDAIMNGGKSGAELLEGIFRNLVLRPVVEFLVRGGMNVVSQIFGLQGGGAAGLLSGGNLLNAFSNIGSIIGGGFSSTLSGTIGSIGSTLGIEAMSSFAAGMQGSTLAAGFAGPTTAGAGGAMGAGSAFGGALAAIPVWGWIAAAAIAVWKSGVFDDGPENPEFRLGFGNQATQGGARGVFGNYGFASIDGKDNDANAASEFAKGALEAMRAFEALDKQLAKLLTPDQIDAVIERLSGYNIRSDGQPATMAFPDINDPAAREAVLKEYLMGKYPIVFDAIGEALFGEVGAKLGDFVRNAKGTSEEITKIITALLQLTQASETVELAIAAITGDMVGQVRSSLDILETRQADAQAAFDAAREGSDPVAVAEAQGALMQAIIDRYNTERQMVMQLADTIAQLQQQAYQFAIAMANRINSVGGSRDVAGIAMGRAGTIRADLSADPARRAGQIEQYLGAIDTWYASRKTEIENRYRAEQQAAQYAQQQAANLLAAEQDRNASQIEALERQLAVIEQWKGVLDSTQAVMDRMRLTTDNPMDAFGRLGMATTDVEAARQAWLGATGQDKIDASGKYVASLQEQLRLLQETYDRPSAEYQAGYNAIMAQLSEVEGVAQTEVEKGIALQEEMTRLQGIANQIGAQIEAVSQSVELNTRAMDAEMESLNREALGYYEWAETQGLAAIAEQERQHQEQLDAITGGMEVDLYLAQLQTRAVDALEEMNDNIREFLTRARGGSTAGGGGGDDSTSNGNTTINVNKRMSDSEIVEVLIRHVPELRRRLSNA